MTDSCIHCGCKGEFKNPDTGEFYVITHSLGLLNDKGFLTSERSCFCATCHKGCESLISRKLRGTTEHTYVGCESLVSRKLRGTTEHTYVGARLSHLLKHGRLTLNHIRAVLHQHVNDYNLNCENIVKYLSVVEECKRRQEESGPVSPHVCYLPNGSRMRSSDGKCCADEQVKESKIVADMLEPELYICEAFLKFAEKIFAENNAATAEAKISEVIVATEQKTFAEALVFWMSQ
jgi:hypothetical protein